MIRALFSMFVALIMISGISSVSLAQEAAIQEEQSSAGASGAGEAADFPEGVVVLIEGKPLTRDEIIEACYERYGMPVLYGLVTTKLIRMEAEKQKITISEDEIDTQYIDEVSGFARANPSPDPAEGFKSYLRQSGLSMKAYRHKLESELMLKKLVENDKSFQLLDADGKPQVSAEEIESAFDATFGPRYNMQLIHLADDKDLAKVEKELASGADFGDVCAKYSSDERLKAARGFTTSAPVSQIEVMLGSQIASKIKGLKVGGYTKAENTSQGVFIVKLVSVEPAGKVKLDKRTEDEIRKEIYNNKLQRTIDVYVEGLMGRDVKFNRALFPEAGKEE